VPLSPSIPEQKREREKRKRKGKRRDKKEGKVCWLAFPRFSNGEARGSRGGNSSRRNLKKRSGAPQASYQQPYPYRKKHPAGKALHREEAPHREEPSSHLCEGKGSLHLELQRVVTPPAARARSPRTSSPGPSGCSPRSHTPLSAPQGTVFSNTQIHAVLYSTVCSTWNTNKLLLSLVVQDGRWNPRLEGDPPGWGIVFQAGRKSSRLEGWKSKLDPQGWKVRKEDPSSKSRSWFRF